MAKLLCACGLGDFSGANPNNNRIPTISKTKPILTQHSPGERCSTGNSNGSDYSVDRLCNSLLIQKGATTGSPSTHSAFVDDNSPVLRFTLASHT